MFERKISFEENYQGKIKKEYGSVLREMDHLVYGEDWILGSKLLGIFRNGAENCYLASSMGWNICRKRYPDYEYSGNMIDKKNKINSEVLTNFSKLKDVIARYIDPNIVNTIDRATNMLSIEYLKLSGNNGESKSETVKRINCLIENFSVEISEIRAMNAESNSTI